MRLMHNTFAGNAPSAGRIPSFSRGVGVPFLSGGVRGIHTYERRGDRRQNVRTNVWLVPDAFSMRSLELFHEVFGNMMFPPEETFEPQMNPAIALVCLIAAVPPVLYWVRFFIRRQQRKEEAEAKEKARLELVRKLTGRDK